MHALAYLIYTLFQVIDFIAFTASYCETSYELSLLWFRKLWPTVCLFLVDHLLKLYCIIYLDHYVYRTDQLFYLIAKPINNLFDEVSGEIILLCKLVFLCNTGGSKLIISWQSWFPDNIHPLISQMFYTTQLLYCITIQKAPDTSLSRF